MSEKRKNKKSKEEIAKQFDLPERQSKIATIMKQDGQVYCICRSSDCSRFMIACDNCEEWYHGDCINVTEKESKHIRQYYCNRCKEENPELQTVFRVEKIKDGTGSHSNSDQDKRKKQSAQQQHPQREVDACGQCMGCVAHNCGNCIACQVRPPNSLTPRCDLRKCLQIGINAANFAAEKQQQQQVYKRSREKIPRERLRKRKRSPSPEVFINPDLEGNRHCYGPGCVKNARPQSKYCSDDCGIRLATARIFQVLPNRLQEYGLSNSRAEEENKKQLDQIRSKQALVRFALTELDRRHQELDLVVENAKHTTLDPNALDNSEATEDEQSMYCFTCGHEIHSRFAVKHMEKCFNKYESQASFGSIFKTRVEGQPMFCDFYNAASKTYCKRLRVLCPEHCKDAKVNDNDVCGCPLVTNVFSLTGEFCRAPKKKCFKHYVWEKIRRAEIDMERVRQWVKMDELLEQERQVRHQMASRAGVLNLMLHSTYNHEVMEELCRAQQQQMMAAQKQKELLLLRQQHNPEQIETATTITALQQLPPPPPQQQQHQQQQQQQHMQVRQPLQLQQQQQQYIQQNVVEVAAVDQRKLEREKQMLLQQQQQQQQQQQRLLQQQKQHHVKLQQQLQYLKQQQRQQQQQQQTHHQQHQLQQQQQIIVQPQIIRQHSTTPLVPFSSQATILNSPPKHIIYTGGTGGAPKTKTIL